MASLLLVCRPYRPKIRAESVIFADHLRPLLVFIGHGLLAFAIAASVAAAYGWDSRRATLVGVVAAAFATLPDVDMAYAFFGLLGGFDGLLGADEVFWASAAVAHRTVTHSLVVGALAAIAFACWRWRGLRDVSTVVAGSGLAALVAGVWLASGPVAGSVTVLFVLGGVGIVAAATRWGVGAPTVGLAAALGLVTHPFGDFFTGAAPALFYPLDVPIEVSLVTLHSDPTLHLLGAFFLELSVIWLAVLVYARLHGWSIRPTIWPQASLGLGYAPAIFVIPAPTLDVPTPFVLSVLAVGLVAAPAARWRGTPERWHVPLAALSVVTVAALAYTGAYLLL